MAKINQNSRRRYKLPEIVVPIASAIIALIAVVVNTAAAWGSASLRLIFITKFAVIIIVAVGIITFFIWHIREDCAVRFRAKHLARLPPIIRGPVAFIQSTRKVAWRILFKKHSIWASISFVMSTTVAGIVMGTHWYLSGRVTFYSHAVIAAGVFLLVFSLGQLRSFIDELTKHRSPLDIVSRNLISTYSGHPRGAGEAISHAENIIVQDPGPIRVLAINYGELCCPLREALARGLKMPPPKSLVERVWDTQTGSNKKFLFSIADPTSKYVVRRASWLTGDYVRDFASPFLRVMLLFGVEQHPRTGKKRLELRLLHGTPRYRMVLSNNRAVIQTYRPERYGRLESCLVVPRTTSTFSVDEAIDEALTAPTVEDAIELKNKIRPPAFDGHSAFSYFEGVYTSALNDTRNDLGFIDSWPVEKLQEFARHCGLKISDDNGQSLVTKICNHVDETLTDLLSRVRAP